MKKQLKPVRAEKQERRHFDIGRLLFSVFLTATMVGGTSIQAFAATTVWDKANEIMKDVYTQILAISTIAAVVTAAIALLLMNFSKSGRTVDESRAWLKRIIITWAILNSLGFIMAYITPVSYTHLTLLALPRHSAFPPYKWRKKMNLNRPMRKIKAEQGCNAMLYSN